MDSAFTKIQTYPQFLRFIFPSVMSMVAVSFYTTIDGFFVSRFVGPDALAAINIVIPYTCVVYGIALMLASGAGAYVSMKLGEQKKQEADGLFSFTTCTLAAVGLVLTVGALLCLEPMLRLLGSTDRLMPYTMVYGSVTVLMTLFMMLKLYFENFTRVDGNPDLAFIMSMMGLVLNLILDFLFIVPMKMGILGAALGTFLSVAASGAVGLLYFLSSRSVLTFRKPDIDFLYLGRICVNGSSQLFTELSTGVVTLLFNLIILKFDGELGVAAVSIIMFLYYFFISIYMGLASGTSPIISYSRGADDVPRIRLMMRYAAVSLLWISLSIFAVSLLGSGLLVRIFSDDAQVIAIAVGGNRLFSLCYLFAGVNVFMAALFTAVGSGVLAAVISTLRCLVFAVAAILLLPVLWGEAGVWLSIPAAEFLTCFFSAAFFVLYRSRIFSGVN